jgi:transcriptional regulator with XRE-family HTH domain
MKKRKTLDPSAGSGAFLFGEVLRTLRKQKGLSLRRAATAANMSAPYLQAIERGTRGRRRSGEHFAPHPQILKRLAAAYSVPAYDLFIKAGFFEEETSPKISKDREIDRCFDFVILDPALKRILTSADKIRIISRYQKVTGRKLLYARMNPPFPLKARIKH